MQGEVSVPQSLSQFYYTLIASGKTLKENPKCIRQVQSLSEDAIL